MFELVLPTACTTWLALSDGAKASELEILRDVALLMRGLHTMWVASAHSAAGWLVLQDLWSGSPWQGPLAGDLFIDESTSDCW